MARKDLSGVTSTLFDLYLKEREILSMLELISLCSRLCKQRELSSSIRPAIFV
jgi:hypothetical protein